MVFESIVADILNRYLGDYVENLDRGQLKIGIWGGEWIFLFVLIFVWKFSSKDPVAREKIDFSQFSCFTNLISCLLPVIFCIFNPLIYYVCEWHCSEFQPI
jgi:hypothetical protein